MNEGFLEPPETHVTLYLSVDSGRVTLSHHVDGKQISVRVGSQRNCGSIIRYFQEFPHCEIIKVQSKFDLI